MRVLENCLASQYFSLNIPSDAYNHFQYKYCTAKTQRSVETGSTTFSRRVHIHFVQSSYYEMPAHTFIYRQTQFQKLEGTTLTPLSHWLYFQNLPLVLPPAPLLWINGFVYSILNDNTRKLKHKQVTTAQFYVNIHAHKKNDKTMAA